MNFEFDHIPIFMKWLEDAELRRMTGTEDATESDIEEAQAMYQTDEDNYGLLIMRKEIETESPPGLSYLSILNSI